MRIVANHSTGYGQRNLYQPEVSKTALYADVLDRAVDRVQQQIPRFGLRNTRISDPGALTYNFCQPREWVAGFWPGQLWLAYSLTAQSQFRNAARMRRPYFERFLSRTDWHNHDLGFLFSLSTVADWKLTADPEARTLAIRAAEALAARLRRPMPGLTCWNPLPQDDPDFARRKAGMIIIDSVENMGLLFWATAVTGNQQFADIAEMHLDTCRAHLVRQDGSTFHCFEFDPATGAPLMGFTHQGHSDESCWARGQAWGIHGFAIAYLATGREVYRQTARDLANFMADHLPEDGVPVWDLSLTDVADAPRDSSAGAIAAAGLFALAQAYADVPSTAALLTQRADQMLASLIARCDLTNVPNTEGLIGEATAFHGEGLINVLTPYGDYFYVEALMRALGHTDFFWI